MAGTSYENASPKKRIYFSLRLFIIIQLLIKVVWKLKDSIFYLFKPLYYFKRAGNGICHGNWLNRHFALFWNRSGSLESSGKAGKAHCLCNAFSAIWMQEYPECSGGCCFNQCQMYVILFYFFLICLSK